MQNNNRAWNLLIAKIDSLEKEVRGFREDFEPVRDCFTRHDEQIKTHAAALKWIFGIVSGVVIALIIAWLRVTIK